MRLVLAALFLCACAQKAKPKPPPAEIAIEGTATFAGTWLTNDDLDWYYRLTVAPDGRLDLTVDRGKLGPCEQRGQLVPGKSLPTFILTLDKDTCTETGPTGGSLAVGIASYTGNQLVLAYGVGTSTVQRTYVRAPQSVQ
ncbi:MAG: hypothetical protein H0T46_04775 [Deltaproteobacteria bacterium]|nr:hypothetical protein [Deltaproteobacteria bacterium]